MNAFWTSLIDTAGWTLVHFVWQGSLGAVVLAFALALVPRGCARVRYVLACLALAAMALLPAVTASYLMQHREDRQAWTLPGRDLGGAPAAHGKSPLTSSVASATAAPVLRVIAPSPPTKWFPWLVGLWMAGVCVCSVRLAGGWWHTRRFTVEDAFAADQAWVRAVEDLSLRLGLWTPVRLLESTRVQVPVVIGTFKPVLLLPASAMTGLSPQQIEAVLAHELAHIRRYDYLVNLVQSCVETVLFYHPGVWWVSHTIRVEREHCCDDLAVSVCGDPVLYARALTNIETLRHDAVGIAMAVSSGSLLSRVRRLLGVRPPARFAASGWAVLSLTAILVASAGLAGWVGGAMKALPAFTDAAEAATLRPDTDGAQASPATERATPAAKPRKAPPAAADVRPDHESDHAGDSNHQADDSRARPELEAAVREMEAALTRKLAAAQRDMEAAIRSAADRLASQGAREAAMRDVERGVQQAMDQAQKEIESAVRMSLDSRSDQEVRGQIDAAARDLHAHRHELESQARNLAAQVMAMQRDALNAHRGELDALSREQARALRESARDMSRQVRELAELLRRLAGEHGRSWRSDRFVEPPPPSAPAAPDAPMATPPDVPTPPVPPPPDR